MAHVARHNFKWVENKKGNLVGKGLIFLVNDLAWDNTIFVLYFIFYVQHFNHHNNDYGKLDKWYNNVLLIMLKYLKIIYNKINDPVTIVTLTYKLTICRNKVKQNNLLNIFYIDD